MKQITIKSSMRLFMAAMLLSIEAVSASAQYYMNIRKTDGSNVRYVVTDIDSVWFSESAVVNYEYVDLGLSVKWATCNVGASSPEDYGDHYAWGETEPKTTYDWSTYKFRTSGDSYLNLKFSKYNTNSDYGTVDNKTILDPEDDVAHVKWGGNWRMPTKAEQDELRSNCTWTWYRSGNTEFNGVAGYKVTSNKSGYTDRFIFLPAAGYRGGTSLSSAGELGNYWSSSLGTDFPSFAQFLYFYSGSHYTNSNSRNNGHSVRPVCP